MPSKTVIVVTVLLVAGCAVGAFFLFGGLGPNGTFATAIVEFDNLASDTSSRRLLGFGVRAPTTSLGTPPDSYATPTVWGRQVVYAHVRETGGNFTDEMCLANTPDEDRCWTEIIFEAPDCCLEYDPDEEDPREWDCTFEGDHCCCAEDEDTLGDRDCECRDGTTRTVTEFFDLARSTADVNADLNSQGLPIMSENQDIEWAKGDGRFRSVTVMYGAHEELRVDVNGTLSELVSYTTDTWSEETDFDDPWPIEEGDVIRIALAYDISDSVLVWDSDPGGPDPTATHCWDDTPSGKYLCFFAPEIVPIATKE